MANDLPAHRFVDDAAGIAAIGARLEEASWVALDTESNSMFVYRERVCLIQLNIEGELYIVDSLAVPAEPPTFAAWREALGNPRLRLYLHGGEYDVAVLKRDYDLTFANLFDTQQAASYLGFTKTGYGSLVEGLCDVALPKEHSQYDWGKRPIDRAALRYALNDVIYLPDVARALEAAAEAADLREEIEIASEAVASVAAHPADYDPEKMWRLKGAQDLDKSGQQRLFVMFEWRDVVAAASDTPPGRIISNAGLVELARRPPRDVRDLKRSRMRGAVVREHGDALLRLLDEAAAHPPEVPPAPKRERMSPTLRARAQRLATWRRAEAERREVPQVVVLPTSAVDYLVRHGADDLDAVPELGPKRAAMYGEQLRDVLRG